MIVMYTITYPTSSAIDFGKAVVKNFQEHPFPEGIKMIGPYSAMYENGIKNIVIFEIEHGKESELFKITDKRLVNYLPVPGFGWKEERLSTMEECLSLVGL